MTRLWFMGWIYGTIIDAVLCLIAGTIAVIFNSTMLGNIISIWAVAAVLSAMGLAITLGAAQVEIPPKQQRPSRAVRKALKAEADRIEFDRRIALMEDEAGLPRREEP